MKRPELVNDIDELKGKQGRAADCGSRTSRRTRPTSTRCCGPRRAASAIRSSATRRRCRPTSTTATSPRRRRTRSTAWCSGDARATERQRTELRARRIHGFAGRSEEAGRRSALPRHREPRGARQRTTAARNAPPTSARSAQLQGALRAQRPADRGVEPDRRRPEALHRPAAAVPPVLLPRLRPG